MNQRNTLKAQLDELLCECDSIGVTSTKETSSLASRYQNEVEHMRLNDKAAKIKLDI